MADALMEAAGSLLSFQYVGYMLLGVAIGMAVGVLPGLGGITGMAIVLPFVYGMDQTSGIALLIGMIAPIHTSDTFPSILIGVPGSGGSQATIMDGYPLARQGQAGRALSVAFISSLVGGLIGGVLLIAVIPIVRPLVLAVASPELFMITILGISIVGVIVRGAPLAGIATALLGMVLGIIGGAPGASVYRFTFDTGYLIDGIPLAVLALGMFAIPELIDLFAARSTIAHEAKGQGGGQLQGLRDVLHNKLLVLRSTMIGVGVGIVPGLGGAVVDWLAYGAAKQSVKNNHFGEGDIRGVIAPESANNAKEGGALMPTLFFGIPGSGTMAMLLGGFVLLGIQPGRRMVDDDLHITLQIAWTLVIANVLACALCFGLTRWVSRVTLIRPESLVPFIFLIVVMAAFQSTRSWGDLIALVVIGIFSWVMKQAGWPRPPMLIGFILAEPAERYLFTSMARYDMAWVTRPGVLVIGIVIVGFVASSVWYQISDRRKRRSLGALTGDVAAKDASRDPED